MKVALLGCTGSIGDSTLQVVRQSQGRLTVIGLSAHNNREKLNSLAKEFSPRHVILTSEPESPEKISALLKEADIVVMAIVGFAALQPTLEALRLGKRVALANKEALVTCGEILTKVAKQTGATIIPVDSEHNALFQALQGHPRQNVKKLWLTGSGGPFREKSHGQLETVTVEEALNHPNWKMGPKITVDSASLMNKGLEFIEARWVFDVAPEKIDVIIHPQSLVHGMVEFIDGSLLAHLAVADMRAAISHALYYPDRQADAVKTLNLAEIGRLDFEPVNRKTFPCLDLAERALKTGGTAPLVLNAANEVAVDAFLNRRVKFLDIPEVISKTLDEMPAENLEWDRVFTIDASARRKASENISSLK